MQIKLSGGQLLIENVNGDTATVSLDESMKIEIGTELITKPGEYEYKNIAIKALDMGLVKLAKINILTVTVDGFSVQIVPFTNGLKPDFEKELEVSDLLFVTSETGDAKDIANITDPYIVFTGKFGSFKSLEEDGLKAMSPNLQTAKTIKLKEGELDSTAETRALTVFIIE